MNDTAKDYDSLIDFVVSRVDIYCNVLSLKEMASVTIKLSCVKVINSNISSLLYLDPDERQEFAVCEVVDNMLENFIYVYNILIITDAHDDITLSDIAGILQIQEARAKLERRVHEYFNHTPDHTTKR